MAKKTIEDIRALIDPEGYVRSMREVLDTYKGNLSRQLVDYDIMTDDETLNAAQRREALARLEDLMRTTLWRMEALEERLAAVKDRAAPEPNRAERRRKAKP